MRHRTANSAVIIPCLSVHRTSVQHGWYDYHQQVFIYARMLGRVRTSVSECVCVRASHESRSLQLFSRLRGSGCKKTLKLSSRSFYVLSLSVWYIPLIFIGGLYHSCALLFRAAETLPKQAPFESARR